MVASKAKHTTGARPSGGELTVDPTENVKALTEAANTRQDDLRDASRELVDTKVAHLQYIVELFARFQAEKNLLEANRIDSIRQVDREEVAKTAASAQTAIATLANTTTTMAETLRNQVANTAAAAEVRQQTYASEVNKRLSALELGSSEGKGRATFADPQIAEMREDQKELIRVMRLNAGSSTGMGKMWGWIVGGVLLFITAGGFFIMLAGTLVTVVLYLSRR